MALERTLSIIKPDGVAAGRIGEILKLLQEAGLHIVALKMLQLREEQARGFYAVHRERPFFDSLVRFMSSGPVVVGILEGADAIARYRELMGATDPGAAAPGTLRQRFGSDVERNAVHGSDSAENAATEIAYFFSTAEICAPAAQPSRT